MSDVVKGMRPFYSPNDRSNPHLHVPVTEECPVAPSLWKETKTTRLMLFRQHELWAGEGIDELNKSRSNKGPGNEDWSLVWPRRILILDTYAVGVSVMDGPKLHSVGGFVVIPPVLYVRVIPLTEHSWLIGLLIYP